MLSLDHCREFAPILKGMTDEEVLDVRDRLYQMAEIGLSHWLENRGGSKNPTGVMPDSREGGRM